MLNKTIHNFNFSFIDEVSMRKNYLILLKSEQTDENGGHMKIFLFKIVA